MTAEGHGHSGTEAQRYRVSDTVVAAAIEVHTALGPGSFGSANQARMDVESKARRMVVQRQVVGRLAPVHTAQVRTSLRLLRLRTGLLINFHNARFRQGVKRMSL